MYDHVCLCMYVYVSLGVSFVFWVDVMWDLHYSWSSFRLAVEVWPLWLLRIHGWCWSPDIFAVDICHSRIPSRISSRYSPFWLTKPPYWLVMLLILTSFPHENDDVPARKIQRFAKKWHRSTGNGEKNHAHMTHHSNSNLPLHVLRKLIFHLRKTTNGEPAISGTLKKTRWFSWRIRWVAHWFCWPCWLEHLEVSRLWPSPETRGVSMTKISSTLW